MPQNATIDNIYALIANDEDARICTDISEDACREVPANFFLIMVSLVMTKLADLLMSPKIVLSWLLSSMGVPATLISWLVPIRESGSLIPQLAIGARIRQHPRRRGFWVAGSLLQGICVAAMAASVWYYDGLTAGYLVLALLVCFSLSRGLCSVAIKDIQGKTIPKSRRGRLSGLASTISGIMTVLVSLWLFGSGENPSHLLYTGLLLAAALLWWLAAANFSFVNEYNGATAGGKNALREALRSLSLLRSDVPFRHFVLTRALLMASGLSAPFFVVLAQQDSVDARLLGGFLLASSLASSLSASFWGWMADVSSRKVLIRAGAIASVICLLVGIGSGLSNGNFYLPWLITGAYFVLSVAHAGVRLGRKTYLIDMAGGTRRTDYVAVSNSIIGVLLLVTGAVSALASVISVEGVLIFLGLMSAIGTISAIRMKEV